MEAILGKTFVDKAAPAGTEKFKDAQIIGVYFSAHWCPPCIIPHITNHVRQNVYTKARRSLQQDKYAEEKI